MAVLTLNGSTSGSVALTAPAVAGSSVVYLPAASGTLLLSTVTMNFPTSLGTANQVLKTDGAGNLSWSTVGGSGTVNSGTANQLAYYATTSSAVSGNASATISGANLTLGVASTTQGGLVLANTSANSVTIKSSNTTSAAWSLTLPTTAGTNNYLMTTDGAGVMSWTDPTNLSTIKVVNQLTVSGTSVTFAGIPSTAKRIIVTFNDVIKNTADSGIVQLGTSGGFQTTSYEGCVNLDTSTYDLITSGFPYITSSNGTQQYTGTMVINLVNSTNNTWQSNGNGIKSSNSQTPYTNVGRVSLSGALTQIKVTSTTGASTFTSGSIGIQYE